MDKKKSFLKRQNRVRGSFKSTGSRKRLSIFRSNKHLYAQIVDDSKATTLVSANDTEIMLKGKTAVTKKELAFLVGEKVAEKALKKGVKSVHFDRSGYKYHGRVKAAADGARKGGLIF